jgi:ketosteroid isomerase-like protein
MGTRGLVAGAALALAGAFALGGCRSEPVREAPRLHQTSEGRLHPSIQQLIGSHCPAPTFCGDVAKVDCGVDVDIPVNYYDNRDGSRLAVCGGLTTNTDTCRPKAWTCPENLFSYDLGNLRKQSKDWDAAIVRKDRAAIAANMSESFQQIGSDGAVADKAKFLDALTSAKLEISPYTVDEFRLRLYGDTALISGSTDMHGKWDGKDFRSHYRFTDTYVLEADGKWRVVNVQTTEIAE